MGSENQAQVIKPAEIAGAAAVVATNLRTRHQPKSHGGYDIYEGERLVIKLDTYVPNIEVRLNTGFGQEVVYKAQYYRHERPSVFRPGAWCDYLLGRLVPEAMVVRQRMEAAAQKRQDRDTVRRYAPIDDAHLFPKSDDRNAENCKHEFLTSHDDGTNDRICRWCNAVEEE